MFVSKVCFYSFVTHQTRSFSFTKQLGHMPSTVSQAARDSLDFLRQTYAEKEIPQDAIDIIMQS